MIHYFGQIAPGMDLETAQKEFWRGLDVFGEEGSREKERAIEEHILLKETGSGCRGE